MGSLLVCSRLQVISVHIFHPSVSVIYVEECNIEQSRGPELDCRPSILTSGSYLDEEIATKRKYVPKSPLFNSVIIDVQSHRLAANVHIIWSSQSIAKARRTNVLLFTTQIMGTSSSCAFLTRCSILGLG